jgi:hypothetical protein
MLSSRTLFCGFTFIVVKLYIIYLFSADKMAFLVKKQLTVVCKGKEIIYGANVKPSCKIIRADIILNVFVAQVTAELSTPVPTYLFCG